MVENYFPTHSLVGLVSETSPAQRFRRERTTGAAQRAPPTNGVRGRNVESRVFSRKPPLYTEGGATPRLDQSRPVPPVGYSGLH